MRSPTPELFRGLARSSPWRWRALELDLHRRPLHGPEHTVHASVERGVGLEVCLADGERHRDAAARTRGGWFEPGTDRHGIRELPFAWELPVEVDADGFVVRRPPASTSDDPMWQDYQWVAMLDPVELADGRARTPSADLGPDAGPPPALDVHRLDASVRHGRETWWAEVSPREDYSPRCSCCPLLFGRVSEELETLAGGPSMLERRPGLVYATAYLVALDVGTGVCVHVEHLDGDHTGRGFSVEIRAVDPPGR
ncbi:MAG TPA: hypothetical protein VES93_11510 [Ornithinibacter sp.]|nr:hypothetical protein [Ornithinibacter sp.]